MKPRYARPLTVLSVLSSSLSAGLEISTVSSHTMFAPDTVYSQSYDPEYPEVEYRVIVQLSDTAQCGDYGWWAVSNIRGLGIPDDCGCRLYGPGQYVGFNVYTDLGDHHNPGVVLNYIYFCGVDSTLSSRTVVMPYNPTESVSATWGRIKALYQR